MSTVRCIASVCILILIIIPILLCYRVNNILYKTEIICGRYDQAEFGDIILFRWKDVNFMHELVSPFTHVGMVITDNLNEKYIIETHLAGDTSHIGVDKGGINIYPLKLRIETYEGHTFLLKLKEEHKPTKEKIYNFILNINNFINTIPFYDSYKSYFKEICIKRKLGKLGPILKKKGMFCSEFTGFCLKELGILESNFVFECLTPDDFRFIKKNGEYIYQKLFKFK